MQEQQPEIQTITQPDKFGQILKDYYAKGQLFIKLANNNNLVVEFVKLSDNNKIYFNIPNIKNLPQECLIVAKLDSELVYGTMKQLEQRRDIFTFSPIKFQIIKFFRKDQRIDIGSGRKQIIFITNLVSSINLETDMSVEKKKVDQIKVKIVSELGKIFERMKVLFIGEKQADSRFRYFSANTNTLYIPNVNDPDSAPDKEQCTYYLENIYAMDYQLKNAEIISEITAPLLYKKEMPYGYIQINSDQPLTDAMAKQIKTYALHVEQIFEKNSIFTPSAERFIVIDVSQGGFAIAFKDKKFLRLFQPNTPMVVEMLLPDKNITIYATVRHITPDSKMITVGFQILAIEKEKTADYESFIKTATS
ncbi:MAG: PilZ domain-containing protein [Spirochaetia bacterium]|jgi:hypothetical protein|nr:PilZ domain-containing protein [Spirochaetia bacterium]